MPTWGIRTVVTKTSIKQIPCMVTQYLNTYRTFTSNTNWNMTHNLHFKTWWGTYVPVHPVMVPMKGRSYAVSNSTIRKSDVGFLGCPIYIVTLALSLTVWPQFAFEWLQCSKQQGWVTLGTNMTRKGLVDVSKILMASGRDMKLSYPVNIFCCLITMHCARTWQTDRQTDRQWNGNIDSSTTMQQ